MLSDALTEYGAGKREISNDTLKMLSYACISPSHAGMFLAYIKSLKNTNMLDNIIAENAKWPAKPEDRDILYFLAQSFRAKLVNELPKSKQDISGNMLSFVYRAKGMIKELSVINFEIAQMVVASDDESTLPDWFMSGPPELPRFMDASVCISVMMRSFIVRSRFTAEIMPAVTVPESSSPMGFPMATARSPSSTASEFPNSAQVRPFASILSSLLYVK